VSCWGSNAFGQLGDGTTTDVPSPSAVRGLVHVRTITAGTGHTCALVKGGQVDCWGANDAGELGDGTTAGSPIPVAVSDAT
jgi:alpha-tubulin suppressor-like RCC1 family protein